MTKPTWVCIVPDCKTQLKVLSTREKYGFKHRRISCENGHVVTTVEIPEELFISVKLAHGRTSNRLEKKPEIRQRLLDGESYGNIKKDLHVTSETIRECRLELEKLGKMVNTADKYTLLRLQVKEDLSAGKSWREIKTLRTVSLPFIAKCAKTLKELPTLELKDVSWISSKILPVPQPSNPDPVQ